MTQLIFGYGSLLEEQSRISTARSAKNAIPVTVKGLTRGWWARTGAIGPSTTFLGCLDANNKLLKSCGAPGYINGVLFEIEEGELSLLDHRETNYTRIELDPRMVQPYNGLRFSPGPVWVYINNFDDEAAFLGASPDADCPIVQSYIDLCLLGCLELETLVKDEVGRFCTDFIRTTFGWNKHWANDRIFPRRPQVYCKNALLFDQLLSDNLSDPTLFNMRYIE